MSTRWHNFLKFSWPIKATDPYIEDNPAIFNYKFTRACNMTKYYIHAHLNMSFRYENVQSYEMKTDLLSYSICVIGVDLHRSTKEDHAQHPHR